MSIYPTKNFEKFYDIEGVRDSDFKKGDKGQWIVDTSLKKKKNGVLKSEGAILYIDRNKREAKGYYYINKFNDKGKMDQNKYPIKLENNNIVPVKRSINKNIHRKIENFKFLVQYTDINRDIKSKQANCYYNYNLPKFGATYEITKKDDLIKSLKNTYQIPYNKADIEITGRDKPNTPSLGNKEIEITFKKNKYYFRDSVDFQPTQESY